MAAAERVPGILGRKIGMTQIYDDAGNVVPVTVIEAGPCDVLQIRTVERDGYEAVQLGFGDKPRRLASRSERGQVAKLDSKRSKKRAEGGVAVAAQGRLRAEAIRPRNPRRRRRSGSRRQGRRRRSWKASSGVDVVAICKGRGFSGAMRRHNFSGQRATHGVKKCHRAIGGTSGSAFPSRVFKGKKMAGQYGNARTTMRNQKLVRIDAEQNLLLIRGAVPGPNGGYVVIKKTNKL